MSGTDDLGAPVSYLTLEEGTAVLSADGDELGDVAHVLADEEEDIFDGIVIDTAPGPAGWRFADAAQVAELHERGVLLRVGAQVLHEPTENPAAMEVDPAAEEEGTGRRLEEKLKRAWDYISGNY
jgi:hypothetical protein